MDPRVQGEWKMWLFRNAADKSTLIAFIRLLEYRLQRALAELDAAWSTYLPYRLQTAENMEPFVLKSFYDIGEYGNVYSTASQGL